MMYFVYKLFWNPQIISFNVGKRNHKSKEEEISIFYYYNYRVEFKKVNKPKKNILKKNKINFFLNFKKRKVFIAKNNASFFMRKHKKKKKLDFLFNQYHSYPRKKKKFLTENEKTYSKAINFLI